MKTKILDGNYISCILIGNNVRGVEIADEEYNNILEIINNCPTAPEGFAYRLTVSLEWELYELPVVDDDDEITDTEALKILLGRVQSESK